MALGLSTGSSSGGDFLPRIQYDARSGRLHRIDRTQTNDGWQTEQTELKFPVQMVIDLENIEVGWIRFGTGAPDFRMVALGEALPPKPGDEHKQGFRVRVFSPKILGGVREWSATAKCVVNAVDDLHSRFVDEFPKNTGKVPVVEWADTMAITSGSGAQKSTNYQPVLKLVKWTDRNDALKSAPKPPPVASVPSTGSGHTPPPGAKTEAIEAPEEF